MQVQSKLAMLALVFAGGAWAAAPAPAVPGRVVVPPPINQTPAPNTIIDLASLAPVLQATIPDAAVAVVLSGDNIGLAGLPFLHANSFLSARITATNSTGTVAPAGTYQVVFNTTNVAAQGSLTLTTESGASVTCALAAGPSYNSFQPCSMTVATSGAAFSVTAHGLTGMAQLEIHSVQLFKLR